MVMGMYYLGTISVAAGAGKNNLSTAVPFSIPAGTDSLLLLASGSDCYAEIKLGDSSTSTTASTGVSIGTSLFQAPCYAAAPADYGSNGNVLSIFNNNAAARTVQVWRIYA